MRIRYILLAVVMVLGLVSIRAWAQQPPPTGIESSPRGELILSGENIGFRVDRQDQNGVQGRLLVKVNGQWREVSGSPGIRPVVVR